MGNLRGWPPSNRCRKFVKMGEVSFCFDFICLTINTSLARWCSYIFIRPDISPQETTLLSGWTPIAGSHKVAMESARDRCLAETGTLRLLHLRGEVLEVGLLVVGAREVRAPLQEGGLLVARPLELRWRGRPPRVRRKKRSEIQTPLLSVTNCNRSRLGGERLWPGRPRPRRCGRGTSGGPWGTGRSR